MIKGTGVILLKGTGYVLINSCKSRNSHVCTTAVVNIPRSFRRSLACLMHPPWVRFVWWALMQAYAAYFAFRTGVCR